MNLLNIINSETEIKLENITRVELLCYNFENEYERMVYYASEVPSHKFFLTDLNELGLFVDSIGTKRTKTGKRVIIVTLKPIPPTIKYHGRRVGVSIASIEKFTELFNKYGTQAVEESDDHEYHIIIDDGIMWVIHWSEISLDELYNSSNFKYDEDLFSYNLFESNFKHYLLHNDKANADTLKFWQNLQRFVNVLDEKVSDDNKVCFYSYLEENWNKWLEYVMHANYKYMNLASIVWDSWVGSASIKDADTNAKQGKVTLDTEEEVFPELHGGGWNVICFDNRYRALGYETRPGVEIPIAMCFKGAAISCEVYEVINGFVPVEDGIFFAAPYLNGTEIELLKTNGFTCNHGKWQKQ